MKRMFFGTLALLLSSTLARANDSSLFTITPSTQSLLQGQSLTLLISSSAAVAGYNQHLSASLDGLSVAAQHPTPSTWIVVAGPYTALSSHNLSLSLELENSSGSSRIREAIRSVNGRIVELRYEIDSANDPKVRKALQDELSSQESLLSMLETQLADQRAPEGEQDFAFSVSPNTTDPNYPSIAGIAPSTGVVPGGTTITITGANFVNGASVLVGGVPATNVSVVNSTTITAVSPPLSAPGAKDIEVDLPALSGGSVRNGVLPTAFYALPSLPPTPDSPPVAITTGSQIVLLGQAITIDGSQSYDWGGATIQDQWSIVAAPAGSTFQPGFAFPHGAQISFTPDLFGVYVLELVVQQTGGAQRTSSPSLAVVSVVGAPQPTAPAIQVIAGGMGTTQITAHDPSPGAAESYSIERAPLHGTAAVNAQGLLTYTPTGGFTGADTTVVRATNQYGLFTDLSIAETVTSSIASGER